MRLAWLSLSALALAGSGCIVVAEDGYGPPAYRRTTVVTQECHHHAGCGHAWDGYRWVHSVGHVHAPGCGHFWHEGRWWVAATVTVPHGHVCNHHCNHYHHSGRWYSVQNHVHRPGCGHELRRGVWVGVKW